MVIVGNGGGLSFATLNAVALSAGIVVYGILFALLSAGFFSRGRSLVSTSLKSVNASDKVVDYEFDPVEADTVFYSPGRGYNPASEDAAYQGEGKSDVKYLVNAMDDELRLVIIGEHDYLEEPFSLLET